VEFRLLGPVEVWHGGAKLTIGGPKPRGLLAVLLLDHGHAVSVDRLVDTLWGAEPPARALGVVQQYVSSLRRSFQTASGRPVISTWGRGYCIEIEPHQLDLTVFTAAMAKARAALRTGRAVDAARDIRAALALWRGDPLGGASLAHDTQVARLQEERLAALEDRIEADLTLGAFPTLVPELTGLVREHPLRERLRGQLMDALCGSGRHGDAITAYWQGRQILADELGVAPGPELTRQYELMLIQQAEADAAAPVSPALGSGEAQAPIRVVGPNLLPSDVGDFTGLEAQADQVVAALTGARRTNGAAVPLVVVAGRPGIGKTTLAVHIAHTLRSEFPDGQLFSTLHGSSSSPADTSIVAASFLRALGVPAIAIPASLDERTEQLRLLLGGRRILMVLDDAGPAEQVRRLMPGDASCAVLITSRTRMSGLAGASVVEIGTWPAEESIALLSQIIGEERVRRDPSASQRIVELCGGLPLAVRIAGARLAARPHWEPGRLADRLADERGRLDELAFGDLEVRPSLALTYQALTPDGRRALRAVTQLDAPSVPSWALAAMLECPLETAEDILDELVDAHLLDPAAPTPAPGRTGHHRYRCHDLVRLYGRERAEAEEDDEQRRAAVGRAVGAWLHLVNIAVVRMPRAVPRLSITGGPVPPDDAAVGAVLRDPVVWFEAEAAALVAAVDTAARYGLARLACDLAHALLSSHFAVLNAFESWWRTHQAAMAAADAGGDRLGAAIVRTGIGLLRHKEDRFDEASVQLQEALDTFVELGHLEGEAVARYGVGSVLFEVAEYDGALSELTESAALFDRLGQPENAVHAGYLMGAIYRERGEFELSLRVFEKLIATYRTVGNERGYGLAQRGISLVHRARGDLVAALALSQLAGEVFEGIGDRLLVAYAHQSTAKALIRLGRPAEAGPLLIDALATTEALRDRFGTALVNRTRGELELAAGNLSDAAAHLDQSIDTWRTLGLPVWLARTQRDRAAVHLAAGDHDSAQKVWQEADAIFAAFGAREHDELPRWRARLGCDCPPEGVLATENV
jgi:DNA-binding SARP family transcriptional activator/tetratricopeptide (TPR) repeat protein